MQSKSKSEQRILEELLAQLLAWHEGKLQPETLAVNLTNFLRENMVVATHAQLTRAQTLDEFRAVSAELLDAHFTSKMERKERELKRLQEQFRVSEKQTLVSSEASDDDFYANSQQDETRYSLAPFAIHDRLDLLVRRFSLGVFSLQSFFLFCSIGAVAALILGDGVWVGAEHARSVNIPNNKKLTTQNAQVDSTAGFEFLISQTTTPDHSPRQDLSLSADSEWRMKAGLAEAHAEEPGFIIGDPDTSDASLHSSIGTVESKLIQLQAPKQEPDANLDSILAESIGISEQELQAGQGRSQGDLGLQEIMSLLDKGDLEQALDTLSRMSAAFSDLNATLIKLEILAGGDSKARLESWELLLQTRETNLLSDMIAARLLLTSSNDERREMFRKFAENPGAPTRYECWIRSFTRNTEIAGQLEALQKNTVALDSFMLDGIFLASAYCNVGRLDAALASLQSVEMELQIMTNLGQSVVYASLVSRNQVMLLSRVSRTAARIRSVVDSDRSSTVD